MKNSEITSLDVDQIWKRVYDEKTDSLRNSLAGAEIKIDLDTEAMTKAIADSVGAALEKSQNIESKYSFSPEIKVEPIVIREPGDIIYVDKVVTDTKTVVERVEVPVIVKEIEYRTVEVPVYITEVKVVEIEKPVVANIQLPKWFNILLVLQTLAIIGLVAGLYIRRNV